MRKTFNVRGSLPYRFLCYLLEEYYILLRDGNDLTERFLADERIFGERALSDPYDTEAWYSDRADRWSDICEIAFARFREDNGGAYACLPR